MDEQPQTVTPLTPEGHGLPAALVAGSVAAAAGAMVWAAVTVLTGMRIGWMAVGVGFLVGYTVRRFGKGTDQTFQVLGAVLSLAGCLAGNLLAVCAFASRQQDLPLLGVLAGLTPGLAIQLIVETFSGMDLVFYGIAVYEGYSFSRVPAAPPPVAGA